MSTSALALKPAVKTVVIADDSAFVRDRFKTALQNAGHRAVTVRSAAELLARVRGDLADIDLLIIDLRLPHGSGAELVRAVRRIDDGQIPILVFSGTISSADEIRALASLGVAGYVNEYSAVQHILPSLAPHLFPDSFNRRGGRRVLLGIPVAYRHKTTVAAALTLNLSKGGIAVRTSNLLALGSRVRARFRLPGSARDIDADAHVAWCDRQAGMGLNFDKLDPADRAEIDSFVDAHFTARTR